MNIAEVKTAINSAAVKREYFQVELEGVKILKPDQVDVSGDTYALTKDGTKSLCKLLEVPHKFYEQLNTDDVELWNIMTKRLEELKNKEVRFAVGQSKEQGSFISSFNESRFGWIPNETFVEIIENILTDNTNLSLKKFYVSSKGVHASLILNDKEASVLGKIGDIFKLGFNLFNSEEIFKNARVSHAIERLVCTNGAVMGEKESGYTMKHTQISQNLVASFYEHMNLLISKNSMLDKYVREKIDVMTSVNASLRELKMAHDIGMRTADKLNERVSDFDTNIPLAAIANKYGLELPLNKSEQWLSTARTPINMYDLYNVITDLASNRKEVTDEEKMEMQVMVGKTFLKKSPDLLDIAPLITTWN